MSIQHDVGGEATVEPPVRFDTKLAVVIREDLAVWQRVNVTAFLVSGFAARIPELVGEPYVDADEVVYLPMVRQPVVVLEADAPTLRAAHTRSLGRHLPMTVFTADLFATGHDAANRAAVRAVPTAALDLVGLALHGPKNAIDKVTKGTHLHP